jgi:hypothetical protein
MTDADWYARRNDRQMRYAGRVLPADRPIVVSLDRAHAATYDGQVAAIVSANLLARMTPALVLDIPDAEIVYPLPWAGRSLKATALSVAQAADPYAPFHSRAAREGDCVLSLGRGPAVNAVHGSGWYAFCGPGASPICQSAAANPIGPAFAVIAAVARLFALSLAPLDGPALFNTFRWNSTTDIADPCPSLSECEFGRIWTVGTGSVGTAGLYFLSMATRNFQSVVFDMDIVKVENLDRSPIFVADDAVHDRFKADVTTRYLRSVGVVDSTAENEPLDTCSRWRARNAGEPDLIIAAANERNVRYIIEQSYPPLQIYGTTGANWGASVFRHTPFLDACSCCVFPPDMQQAQMRCAEGSILEPETGREVDAALPFLSFAAGLMTAAEILKTALPGYPFSANRTIFSTGPFVTPRFTSLMSPLRNACGCQDRSQNIHRRMIKGTRFECLSISNAA